MNCLLLTVQIRDFCNSFAFIENDVAKTVYENDINIGEKEDYSI